MNEKTSKNKNKLEETKKIKLYRRLLEFENNIQDKKYTRKDLGF